MGVQIKIFTVGFANNSEWKVMSYMQELLTIDHYEAEHFLPYIITSAEIQVYKCNPNQATLQRMAPKHHSKRSSEDSMLEVKFGTDALFSKH